MKLKNTAALSLIIGLVATSAWSSTPGTSSWLVDLNKGSGSVEFHATGHPSALKIVGKGSAPKGNFNVSGKNVSGVVTFDLNSLDTGIGLRTHHMKEKYLETGKYAEAKLTIKQMVLPADFEQDHFSGEVPFNGTLSLHGVEKPVSGTAKLDKGANQVSIAANFGLKVSDYGISVPKYAGITMADDVQVSVADSAPVSAATKSVHNNSKRKHRS